MLVLTRKPGETIHIGDAVVHVVSNGKGRVRLSIEAPKETKILRGELFGHGVTDQTPLLTK